MPEHAVPQATESERWVLGAVLGDPERIAEVLEEIDESMFYRDAHRRVFAAMTRVFQLGAVVEAGAVAEELKRTGELQHVGGVPYISELLDYGWTSANVEYHVRRIRETDMLRRLLRASEATIQDATRPDADATQAVDQAQARLMEVGLDRGRNRMAPVSEAIYPTLERIENRTRGIRGMSTGFPELDTATGGLEPGQLIYIGGRPSMGKTAFATTVALHAALELQVPVAFISLEQTRLELTERFLAHEGMVDLLRLRNGNLRDEDCVHLAHACGQIKRAPIWIDDSTGVTLLEVAAKLRRWRFEHRAMADGRALAVIDYINLMDGRGESRLEVLSAISRGLKALAKLLAVPLLVPVQLSRKPEERASHRPLLSDLRESGSLEQDADLVLFPYRPSYYGEEGDDEVKIAKQRNGPRESVRACFRESCARWEPLERMRMVG